MSLGRLAPLGVLLWLSLLGSVSDALEAGEGWCLSLVSSSETCPDIEACLPSELDVGLDFELGSTHSSIYECDGEEVLIEAHPVQQLCARSYCCNPELCDRFRGVSGCTAAAGPDAGFSTFKLCEAVDLPPAPECLEAAPVSLEPIDGWCVTVVNPDMPNRCPPLDSCLLSGGAPGCPAPFLFDEDSQGTTVEFVCGNGGKVNITATQSAPEVGADTELLGVEDAPPAGCNQTLCGSIAATDVQDLRPVAGMCITVTLREVPTNTAPIGGSCVDLTQCAPDGTPMPDGMLPYMCDGERVLLQVAPKGEDCGADCEPHLCRISGDAESVYSSVECGEGQIGDDDDDEVVLLPNDEDEVDVLMYDDLGFGGENDDGVTIPDEPGVEVTTPESFDGGAAAPPAMESVPSASAPGPEEQEAPRPMPAINIDAPREQGTPAPATEAAVTSETPDEQEASAPAPQPATGNGGPSVDASTPGARPSTNFESPAAPSPAASAPSTPSPAAPVPSTPSPTAPVPPTSSPAAPDLSNPSPATPVPSTPNLAAPSPVAGGPDDSTPFPRGSVLLRLSFPEVNCKDDARVAALRDAVHDEGRRLLSNFSSGCPSGGEHCIDMTSSCDEDGITTVLDLDVSTYSNEGNIGLLQTLFSGSNGVLFDPSLVGEFGEYNAEVQLNIPGEPPSTEPPPAPSTSSPSRSLPQEGIMSQDGDGEVDTAVSPPVGDFASQAGPVRAVLSAAAGATIFLLAL